MPSPQTRPEWTKMQEMCNMGGGVGGIRADQSHSG